MPKFVLLACLLTEGFALASTWEVSAVVKSGAQNPKSIPKQKIILPIQKTSSVESENLKLEILTLGETTDARVFKFHLFSTKDETINQSGFWEVSRNSPNLLMLTAGRSVITLNATNIFSPKWEEF